jgi:hypothetical protein
MQGMPESRGKGMNHEEWLAEGEKLFGSDQMKWKFVCPACGVVTSVQDWKEAGAPETAVAFSCVGRWSGMKREAFGGEGPGPCNYAGGGLFNINPVKIYGRKNDVFAFATEAKAPDAD